MTVSAVPEQTTTGVSRFKFLFVPIICFLTIVFDGYDLVVFGSTTQSILADKAWNFTPEMIGYTGSLALAGMFIGTMSIGAFTEVLGRRRILIVSVSWFSVGMLLTALAPNAEVFMALRFFVGLGLGAVVPTCIAMTVEFSPKKYRQIVNAIMFSGYPVGGVVASLLAINLLPALDFRWLYAFGGLPVILTLPLIIFKLPESVSYLAQRRSEKEARAVAAKYGLVYDDIVLPSLVTVTTETISVNRARGLTNFRQLFSARWLRSTLLFTLTFFCGLLLVYGMNTWLPQIMAGAGYNLGASLTFLLVFNVGAVIGGIGASFLASRWGDKRTVMFSFGVAFVAILVLSIMLPQLVLYTAVFLAGWGTVGTQTLVTGYCATHYPQHLSPSMLGWGLGVGRLGAISGPLVGGYIASHALGYQVNFYVFAAVAAIGLVVVLAIPRNPLKLGKVTTTS
ncbi:aromatic acid/H+ symport family MFS transporter [Klugiella xanthotipulae]|uniref:AAHS family benzoate transporter-like MFS transporter n=1 Tax=Klugiella xanthotipulae TaxID=244735 RepID=A0A543HT20_9MICO|nr:aromatic acid/H+ symport family MFS transporter [Klugiella xanthotipulae]TQM61495.1 AAHS family benzoate transporter-like MFS transporter [Klugiella xanthotipulae]